MRRTHLGSSAARRVVRLRSAHGSRAFDALARAGRTVRAAVITELGRAPELAERPDPSGEAIYEVSAVSLNPIDVNVGAGRYFGGHPELPYVPGCEGVGRAPTARASTSSATASGSPATGCWRSAPPRRPTSAFRSRTRSPTRSQRRAASPGWRAGCPSRGARPCGRTTACSCSARPARSASSQRRRPSCSAPRASWPSAAIPSGCKRAAELGADATVSLEEDDLVAAFKEAAGGDGPTHIVDTLWGAPAAAAIQAAAPGWRLVQVGQSAGAEATLASAGIRGKMGELYGYTDFAVAERGVPRAVPAARRPRGRGRDRLRHRDVSARAGRRSLAAPGRRRGRQDRRHADLSRAMRTTPATAVRIVCRIALADGTIERHLVLRLACRS